MPNITTTIAETVGRRLAATYRHYYGEGMPATNENALEWLRKKEIAEPLGVYVTVLAAGFTNTAVLEKFGLDQAPSLIGEIGALTGLARTTSVKALGPARVYRIARAQLFELTQESPELLMSVVRQLGQQIDSVNKAVAL